MSLSKQNYQWILLSTLVVLMLATRFHHFGSVSFLPDASLAVFFLAGLLLPEKLEFKNAFTWLNSQWVVIALLMVLAGVIDYLAINQGGVSDWCISPAYMFLIPTYLAMYFAGRYAKNQEWQKNTVGLSIMLCAFVGVCIAFVISNGSFFLFSGRYADMGIWQYSANVAQYFAPYAGYTLMYTAIVQSLCVLLGQIRNKHLVIFDGFLVD